MIILNILYKYLKKFSTFETKLKKWNGWYVWEATSDGMDEFSENNGGYL